MPRLKNFHNKAERVVAFVVARLSSSRLPAKQLRQIGEKPILQWITDNLKHCQELDQIVIATAAEDANRPLRDFAEQQGLDCFWYEGDVNQVTTRLSCAAHHYAADICLLISGDCPLVYAPAIDQLVREFRSHPDADYVALPPSPQGEQQTLEGVHVARRRTWQRADELADRPELKEHQFPVIGQRPDLFKPLVCKLENHLYAPAHRYSVDTRADLEFMNQLHERLARRHLPFQLPEALQLLRETPQLQEINRHVHQRRLVEPDHKVLFVIDSGSAYGFGHLMRSLELADQLTERQGWPVTFLIDDENAAALLEQRGLPFYWGAFARAAQAHPRQQPTPLADLLPDFSLLVLDIFDQRDPAAGWRTALVNPLPIAVIDNRRSWASEADLIITPGVTAQEEKIEGVKHLAGRDYLILRREVRRAALMKQSKSLDLLVYLHDANQRKALSEFANRHHLQAKILHHFTPEMPQLLAQAKCFISGFGISFYEALLLKTMPICWPDSTAHRRDAETFYQRMDLPTCILHSTNDLQPLLLPRLNSGPPPLPELHDGTPDIVKALAQLVETGRQRTSPLAS